MPNPFHSWDCRVRHDWLSTHTLTFLSILTNTWWFCCLFQGLRMRTETKVWNRKCLVWLVYLINWHWCPLGHWMLKFLSSFMSLFGDGIHTCICVHIHSHISWDFWLGPLGFIGAISFGCLLMTWYLTSRRLLPQILFVEFTFLCRCSSWPESRTTQVFFEVTSYQGNQPSSCLIKLKVQAFPGVVDA